jgi:Kef-type K+ transport system membrane component KefB
MAPLTSSEISSFFLAVGVLLTGAIVLGHLAQRLNQPAIVGELLAGIVLGPSLFGAIAGGWAGAVIPLHAGRVSVLWDGLTTFSVTVFMLAAGMEVELARVLRQTRRIATVSVSSMILPLGLGFAVASAFPASLGHPHGVGTVVFALFFGTALAISALPVIAKTLFDLKLYDSDVGVVIMAAAMINDFSGWILFGVLLALTNGAVAAPAPAALRAVFLTFAFAALILTVGRWLIDRALHSIRTSVTWRGSALALIPVLALFGGAVAETIGVHAIFGAFLVGVAVGNSSELADHDKETITRFVTVVLAPLFFVSLGLKMNFVANFDARLVAIVLAIACAGKLVGAKLGCRVAGISPREGWAIAFGLNSRGAMEIVLATLLLQRGLIEARLFEALVLMALATSMISGPAIQVILKLKHSPAASERSRSESPSHRAEGVT